MRKYTYSLVVKSILLVLVISLANVLANGASDISIPKGAAAKSYNLAVRSLTNELRNVFKQDVRLELTNIRQNSLNSKTVKIEGEGVAIFQDEERLPLQFSFSTNQDGVSVANLQYEFIASEAPVIDEGFSSSPDKIESALMREIMNQVHRDYKTTNIVIAIDDYQKTDGNNFKGSGEIRLGDMVWRQIDFNVTLDERNEKAKKIIYKLLK